MAPSIVLGVASDVVRPGECLIRMPRRITLAIDLGHHVLRAAQVRPGRTCRVVSTLFERMPDDLDRDDAVAVGRCLAAAMARAGMSFGPAVFALDRSITSLKRIELPTVDPDELPDMVGIAVERDLPIDAEEAVIDFTVLERREESTLVEAVAVPQREIDRIRGVAEAAGLSVARVAPRCHGGLRLADPETPTLLVDVTGEGLEIVLAADGGIAWSRGVEIAGPDGGPPTAGQLVPETRRSWISYRLSSEEFQSPRLLVLGGERVEEAVEAVAEATGLEASRFIGDLRVQPETDMRGAWPLVGLLLPCPAGSMVDLSSPRRPPDLQARWRQRILAVAGLGIVAMFAGWTMGARDLEKIEAQEIDYRERALNANQEYLRFKRDGLRADHLEAWTSIRPDWLEQLQVIAGPTITRGDAVLGDFVGTLQDVGIEYDRDGGFDAAGTVRLVVEGEGGTRETVAGLRDELVGDDRFVLRNTGSDARGGRRLPYPFGFDLRTRTLDPGPEDAVDPTSGEEEE